MKKFFTAIALTVALPGVAFAQTAEKPKDSCCCEKKDGEKGCCDKDMKDMKDKKAGHDHPAGHDMSKM